MTVKLIVGGHSLQESRLSYLYKFILPKKKIVYTCVTFITQFLYPSDTLALEHLEKEETLDQICY